jgi:hypothetical protein
VAVEDPLGVADLVAGAVVLDALVGVEGVCCVWEPFSAVLVFYARAITRRADSARLLRLGSGTF